MAIIKPFNAYRYNTEKTDNIDALITQPYDKISVIMQKAYYQKSPYNIVRIILSDPAIETISNTQDKYIAANQYLEKWISEQVLVQDKSPGIYVYSQNFILPNGAERQRTGFIAIGKIGDSKIHAHENTLSGPKKDRLDLLRATKAHFGQIFMLYEDREQKINNLLKDFSKKNEPLVIHDEDQNTHKLWQCFDKAIISQIQNLMLDKELFIADGHHRYETAMNYKTEAMSLGQYNESMDFCMMTFVNMYDQGLAILPTHRCIKNIDFNLNNIMRKLENNFIIKQEASIDDLQKSLDANQDKHSFGILLKDQYYLLVLHSQVLENLIDVEILHQLILEDVFNITEADQKAGTKITYVRKIEEAVHLLASEEVQACFLLNPTKIEEIKKTVLKGKKMPQKSTDFYPKLLTGLTIYKLE